MEAAHSSLRHTLIALVAGFVTLLGVGAPTAAKGAELESGLVFRSQEPLTLKSGSTEQARTVVLCNASRAVATGLDWSLGGFQFTNGDKTVKDAEVVTLAGAEELTRLLAGACASVTIEVVASPGVEPGPFSGELVVTSAGSGVARLKVEVAGPTSTVVPTTGAAETIELTATRKLLFSESVSLDGDSSLALKAPPKGKSLKLAPKGSFIGNLVNGGDVASVFVTGAPDKGTAGVWLLPIEVRGAAHTGKYEGTLTPTGSDDEKQTVKAKVTVTVWWVWAVLAVLLGALLVVLPTLYVRRWRLESELHDRHKALADAYSAAGECFHQHFPRFNQIQPPSPSDVSDYAEATDAAIRAYAESTWYFDTTSDAYAKIVQSLDAAEADAACLREESGLGKALTELEATLKTLAGSLKANLPIDRQPAIALAANALLQPGWLAVGEATIRAGEAKEALEGIQRWTEMAQSLKRFEVWYRALEKISVPSERDFSNEDRAVLRKIYAAIGEARNELLEAVDAEAIDALKIQDRLTKVYGDLAILGSAHRIWVSSEPPPAGSDGAWPRLKLEKDGESTDISDEVQNKVAAIQEQLPDAVSDQGSWRANADALIVSPAKPVELGRTKRFIGDAMVVVLSAATGTVASLSAFYFGKTFGTVEDFLTVIFVGTAAQAFLKPVTDTLAKLRGDTEPVTKSDPETAAATNVTKEAGLAADNG